MCKLVCIARSPRGCRLRVTANTSGSQGISLSSVCTTRRRGNWHPSFESLSSGLDSYGVVNISQVGTLIHHSRASAQSTIGCIAYIVELLLVYRDTTCYSYTCWSFESINPRASIPGVDNYHESFYVGAWIWQSINIGANQEFCYSCLSVLSIILGQTLRSVLA